MDTVFDRVVHNSSARTRPTVVWGGRLGIKALTGFVWPYLAMTAVPSCGPDRPGCYTSRNNRSGPCALG